MADDLTPEQGFALIEATTEQLLAMTAKLGDFGTAGHEENEHTASPVAPATHPAFVSGRWTHLDCRFIPAHTARIGPPITPMATGLHTTDMVPSTWKGLIDRWHSTPGDGACATFLIGRSRAEGVVQMVPIDRNANHLGGPGHGNFVINGKTVHPNTVTNGIEVHCAGGVQRIRGVWRFVEGGVASGEPLPDEDVIADPQRPGRGWHVITDYQLSILDALLRDLDTVQVPLPAGSTTIAYGESVPTWALHHSRRVVGHVEMDPVHRSDPWPGGMSWLIRRELLSAPVGAP